MKPRRHLFLGSFLVAAFGSASSALAANIYWDAAPADGNWTTINNWNTNGTTDSSNPGAYPGAGDVAIFNRASSSTTITMFTGVATGDITIDTANASAFTFGSGAINSQSVTWATGKTIQMTSTVANNQLFNARLYLGGTSSASGTYSIKNDSTTNNFTFAGDITAQGAGNKVLAFSGAGLINIDGAISKGSATTSSITKTGAGSLKINSTGVINSANSTDVTGTITGGGTLDINGGTVRFRGATALAVGDNTTAGNVIVRAGSTLQLTGAIAIGQGSSGTGNTPVSTFTQYGGATTIGSSSTLYLGNYRGATMDIQGGTLTSSSAANIGVRGNSTMTISGVGTAVTFSNILLGNTGGTTTATSDLNLNGGTLTLGASGIGIAATAGAKTVSFDGGTLKASAGSTDFVNADFLYVKAGGATIDTNAFDVTIDNGLLQSGVTVGALSKISAGTLKLTGTNTYTGGSSVSAGILQFGQTAALPSSGAYAATGTGTLAVNAGGGGEFTNATSGAGSIGGFFSGASFASGTAFGIDTSNAGGSLSYAGNFTGTGIGITKLGTGTLTLSGNNNYTGTTTINAGTLQAGSATAFNNTSDLTMANAAGVTFDLGGFNASFKNLTTGAATNSITTTGAGSGTDTLTLSALSSGSNALFTDNGTRKLAVSINGTTLIDPLSNTSNTFSGGLTLVDNIRLGAASNSVATGGKFGKGTITMGVVSGDTAQIYFSTSNITITNPFIVNTAANVGSRTGAFRVDSTGNTLSGQIDANLADAVFINGSAANGAISLSGKITGLKGLQVNSNAVGNPLKLTLSNTGTANDYIGNTTVGSFSTLVLGAANQIPNSTGKGNVALAGTLDLNGYSETINGISGAGTIDNLTDGAGLGTNTLTLGDNDNAIGTGFTGVIKNTAGSLAISKVGTGAMTFSGNNSFSGGLTVGGTGAVTLSHDNAAGVGTIALQSTNAGINSILVTSGGRTIANNITMDASTGRNNIGNAGGVTALNGNITINNTGNIHIIQNNASDNALMTVGKTDLTSTITAATFASNLSFRGTSSGGGVINSVFNAPSMTFETNGATNWTINSTGNNWGAVTGILSTGNLILGATGALDSGARLDHSGAGDLILNGNNQTIAGLNQATAVAGAQLINNSTTSDSQLTLAGLTQDYTYANVIADGSSSKVSLVMNSAGRTQTLTGTNTYTGTTTITAGALQIGNNTTTGTLGVGNVVNDDSLVFNRSNDLSVSNDISGAGSITKLGAGTLTLSGSNTYLGSTTITAGSLKINSAGALGGTTVTMSGTGNSALVLADAIAAGSGKSLTIKGGGVGGFFGALTNVTGATGVSEWQGSVTIGDATGTRVGAQGGTLKISGNIGDTGAGRQLVIRNSNTGKTILSGTNTYTGETLINASGGELQIEGGSAIHDTGLVNIANSAGNIFRVTGSETIGALTGGGNTTAKAIIEASQTLTLSSGTQTFAGVIEGSGALTVNGAQQTLTNQNTYSSGTTVTAGNLALGHATNTLADSGAVNVNGGELALGTNTDTVGAVTLTSGSITGSGAGTLTGTGSNYDFRSGSVSAMLGGIVGLDKTTGGTVTLSGANSYTGTTTVSAGTLAVSGTGSLAAGSAVTVEDLGTLSVAGTINGSLAVDDGGTLTGNGGTFNSSVTINGIHSPGASPGLQTFTNGLTYGSTATLNAEFVGNTLGLRGTDFDGIDVTGGDLSIDSLATLNLLMSGIDYTLAAWDLARDFTVIDHSGGGNSSGLFILNTSGAGSFAGEGSWSLANTSNDIVLSWTPVPEPRAAILGLLGTLALLRRRR